MIIESSAPTRIDLAGGTLDIHPLNVFLEGGITVNAGIELRSYVKIETRNDKEIHLYSEDLKVKEVFKNINSISLKGRLSLVARIVKYYNPKFGLNISTKNTTPLGSGLGASSSLLISLSSALNKLKEKPLSKEEIIDFGANIEAQEIGIPTGKQDYYAAMYGGINAIWFNLDKNILEPLVVKEKVFKELEERLILSFTGVSHFSATNNWNMLKRYIDDSQDTRLHMKNIKETSLKMRECLMMADFKSFAKILNEEWANRKKLAKGVSNARIDKIMNVSKSAGALGSKICGAGGGGCMITFVKEGKKESVINALKEICVEILPLKISRSGVKVKSYMWSSTMSSS